jgi:hypothetical protein
MCRSSSVRRAGAAVVGGVLTTGALALVVPAPQAHAATDPAPSAEAADWLAGELVNGALESDFGPDWGLSIDAGLALQEVGGHAADVTAIKDALATNIDSYVKYAYDFGGKHYEGTIAGATAKSAVFAEATGADVTSFGGENLVTTLEGLVQPSGRIEDQGTVDGAPDPYADYANVIGQTFAARALTEQSSGKASAAVDFLLTQQCAAGFFRQDFTKDDSGAATDAGCVAGDTPSVDTTALAVVILQPLVSDPDVSAALTDAVAWLKTQQAANGSLGLGSIPPNANSTSIAGWAFQEAGATGPAAKAARWVRALQLTGTECDGQAKADAGAVAYTPGELADAVAGGISDRYKVARVVTQAAPALLAAPAATTNLHLGPVPRFLDGGAKQKLTPSGLAPGERGCARIGGKRASVVGDADGTDTVRVDVPDRTQELTVSVQAGNQAVGTPKVALAAKQLPVDLRASVQPGGTQRVVVRGLWPGEKVVVKNAADVVARGHAAQDGTFVAKFPVGRKPGGYEVGVRGQFADRQNLASYQVG